MTERNDGGPASPVTNDAKDGEQGMTLRDWFAGIALQGMCSNPNHDLDEIHDVAVRNAWRLADAMIAERSK